MRPLYPSPEYEELLDFLGGVGWFPGRRTDLRPHLEVWTACGYRAFDAARDFIAECAGIEFEYPRHSAIGGFTRAWCPGLSLPVEYRAVWWPSYEKRINRELCPVGQSASGNVFLLMSPDGIMYGGRDWFFVKVSDDGYHALFDISRRVRMISV
ncbi:SUKH-3 domain-containing protein [Streptomyces sp. NPDC048385]|uniref:SUKH-3 domain-containing protein n=1 Tax=unclassified Streptomyces TaxID=2593676 RepID=UPI0034495FB6